MSSPALDLPSKGLLRIVRAVYLGASHLEFALYLSPKAYDIAKQYLREAAGFREEKAGKMVLRTKFYNIFVYRT